MRDWLKQLREPLTVVTGLLFLATLALYCSTRDLVKGAERTAERQLCAFVFLTGTGIIEKKNGKDILAVAHFKNFGQTPAYNMKIYGKMAVGDYPLRKKLPALVFSVDRSSESIGPTDTRDQYQTLTALPSGEKDAVIAKRSAIYLYGTLFYRDAFGKARCTAYRFFYVGQPLVVDVDNLPSHSVDGSPMGVAQEGNQTEQDTNSADCEPQ